MDHDPSTTSGWQEGSHWSLPLIGVRGYLGETPDLNSVIPALGPEPRKMGQALRAGPHFSRAPGLNRESTELGRVFLRGRIRALSEEGAGIHLFPTREG